MNECREYRRMIIHFFSRDLTGEEEKILKEHLGRCEECKKEFVLQGEMESILQKRPLSKAPVAVIERVLSIIPERKEVYARPHFNWRVAVSIASVVAAWIIVSLTHYFTRQPGVLSTFIEVMSTTMTNFSLNFTKPSFIIGTVIYSLVVSFSTLFIFWRSQLRKIVVM
ncbi:zf-HC2 domain-containing protein [candidate division WOR-3 bacterium]|nr:zf-HC2 domain-containing protein [candidate division WOR-3 bacterium]